MEINCDGVVIQSPVTFHFQRNVLRTHGTNVRENSKGRLCAHSICVPSFIIRCIAPNSNQPSLVHTHSLLKNSTRTRAEFVQLVNRARCKEHYFKLDLPLASAVTRPLRLFWDMAHASDRTGGECQHWH